MGFSHLYLILHIRLPLPLNAIIATFPCLKTNQGSKTWPRGSSLPACEVCVGRRGEIPALLNWPSHAKALRIELQKHLLGGTHNGFFFLELSENVAFVCIFLWYVFTVRLRCTCCEK